ncbi:MAG: OmpA family protein [Bacteroidota bacterium]
MKRIITVIIFTISLSLQALAQDQLTKMQLADNLFDRDEYFKSLSIYLELAKKNQPKLHAVERVAECYRLMNDYDNAEIWYKKAVDYPEAQIIDHFYYAEMLHRNKKFKEARDEYKIYADYENAEILPFKTAMVDSAQKWMKTPSPAYALQNEQKFNTKYSDWGLNYLDKSVLVFTSDRKVSEKQKEVNSRNGDGYYKLYKAEGDVIAPIVLAVKDNPIFTGNYHVGPIAVTTGGDTAYITVTTTVPKSKLLVDKKTIGTAQNLYTRRLQLVIATKIGGQWANFKNFSYNNVKEYSVGHAALANNGSVIYFASDMPEGEGGTDIWYCLKKADGTWDTPLNCGKVINTKENESFPTLSADGNSLYFSSNGLPGMGGLDIFRSAGKQAAWSKPVNLKYPLNSTSDDFYYLTKNDTTGYISSNREGGKGSDDIYSFGYDRSKTTEPAVTIAQTNKPKDGAAAPAPVVSNTVPAGGVKVPASSAIGNAGKGATVPSPQPSSAIATLKKGEGIILNNIYYDVNKSNIRADAAEELDRLAEILKEHPSIRLEVGSHTDSRAPSTYNLMLSRRRADSAVAYLVKRGIAADRLVAIGYGDTRLLNKCQKGEFCSEDEHQINRRTEVHILQE